jgi:hypothetical protein
MTAPDLPTSLVYVANGLIWHIAQIAQAPSIPNTTALCARQARDGRWKSQCQGGWPVRKLCLACRATLKGISA